MHTPVEPSHEASASAKLELKDTLSSIVESSPRINPWLDQTCETNGSDKEIRNSLSKLTRSGRSSYGKQNLIADDWVVARNRYRLSDRQSFHHRRLPGSGPVSQERDA